MLFLSHQMQFLKFPHIKVNPKIKIIVNANVHAFQDMCSKVMVFSSHSETYSQIIIRMI